MKKIGPQDKVLHFSFGDEPFGKASVFCGQFTKRQISNKSYKPLDPSVVKLPFKDKVFDIIYCSHVFQFVNHPKAMLEEMKRISKSIHIREHSEFAELLFGWPEHRWVINVENGTLVIKEKNDKYGKFLSFFHGLYVDDPMFYDLVGANEGLFKIAVDWYEEDDEISYEDVNDEDNVFVDGVNDDDDVTILGHISSQDNDDEDDESEDSEEYNGEEVQEVEEPLNTEQFLDKLNIKTDNRRKIVKTVFRPCQIEYFDFNRIELGKISDKIDVLNLKKDQLF